MTIKEKEEEMTKRVKEELDRINYRITMIFTNYNKACLYRDGSIKELLITTFVEPMFDKSIHIYSDVKTFKMLYIQTGPRNFVEIEHFFANVED